MAEFFALATLQRAAGKIDFPAWLGLGFACSGDAREGVPGPATERD